MMKCLLVLFAVAAAASYQAAASPVLLTYPYLAYQPYQPIVYKTVPKEVEVELKSFQAEIKDTDCKNVFGLPVPCRSRRSAEEEAAAPPAEAEAEVQADTKAAKKDTVLAPAVLPYFYPYSHLPFTYYSPLALPQPKVQELEVPVIKYKHVVEKVPVLPACRNSLGLAVPCNI